MNRTCSPFVAICKEGGGQATKTDSCSQHTRTSRRGGHEQRRALSPSVTSGLPYTRFPEQPLSRDPKASRVTGRLQTPSSCPDNGSAYRSSVHAIACRALGIRHLRTRPYRPQTNGKAERFIRTMLGGWAYGAIYRDSHERTAALQGWIDFYNRRRPHGALSHKPPIARLNELNNLLRSYS
jgi:hypothetical protein